MMQLQLTQCVRCQYDLRGSPGDVCPECGTQQPGDAFDLAVVSSNVDSDRTTRAKWLVWCVIAAIVGTLGAFGMINTCGCVGVLLLVWMVWGIATGIMSGMRAGRGIADLHVLVDRRGIHLLRENRAPKQLCDWNRPYRHQLRRLRGKGHDKARWRLRAWIAAWSFMLRAGKPDVRLEFEATPRRAAAFRRFVKDAVDDRTPGPIKRPRR